MAFDISGLSLIGEPMSNGPRIWTYTTTDAIGTVDNAGYFAGLAGQMKLNDFVFIVSSTGGVTAFTLASVQTNDGSSVTVGPLLLTMA